MWKIGGVMCPDDVTNESRSKKMRCLAEDKERKIWKWNERRSYQYKGAQKKKKRKGEVTNWYTGNDRMHMERRENLERK